MNQLASLAYPSSGWGVMMNDGCGFVELLLCRGGDRRVELTKGVSSFVCLKISTPISYSSDPGEYLSHQSIRGLYSSSLQGMWSASCGFPPSSPVILRVPSSGTVLAVLVGITLTVALSFSDRLLWAP